MEKKKGIHKINNNIDSKLSEISQIKNLEIKDKRGKIILIIKI